MIHVLIEGSVQGVGYRQFVKSRANKLNIRGWVKNLPDRRVEAMFLGSQEKLDLMIEQCRKGPFLAEVESLEIKEIPDQTFDSFEIIK